MQHPQTKANALMVTGHTMVTMMSRVTTTTEMRMIWRVVGWTTLMREVGVNYVR